MGANFTPEMLGYTGQGPFRYWCQKVLPLVYDDSLSYLEVLHKVTNYLNNTISDVANMETNIGNLVSAFNNLQNYVNEHIDDVEHDVEEFKEYVTNYLANLDVQDEINNKLDEMVTSGTMTEIISPIANQVIPPAVTAWLDENVEPTGSAVIVDDTLTISGAAADAKITGDEIIYVKNATNTLIEEMKSVLVNTTINPMYSLGDYNVNGYVKSNKKLRSAILPAGRYSFSGLSGYRFSVYKYISDVSGEQITTYRTGAITYTYDYPIIVVIAKPSTDTSDLTTAEIAEINSDFIVQDINDESFESTIDSIDETYIQNYNSATNYVYSDYVRRDNKIYQARSDYAAESWTAGHWEERGTLGDILRDKLNSVVICEYYSRNRNYAKGDFVLYNNKLYRANQDITAESWKVAHWELLGNSIAEILDKIVEHPVNDKYVNYAHRGDRVYAPFNTLPAFAKAKQLGYNAVEFDVRFTSDGVPVILHDSTINATARNADGTVISDTISISNITYAEALTYDFGIWFSEDYAGTKIPTLEQTLSLCKKLDLMCAIEIKQTSFTNVQAKRIVDAVLKYGWMDKTVFTCFTLAYLKRVYNNNPRCGAGYVFTNGGNDLTIINNSNDATGLDAIEWLTSIAKNNKIAMAISNNVITQNTSDTLEAAGVNLITFVESAASEVISVPTWASGCITEQVPDSDIDDAIIEELVR